jgi:uncharacterized protein (TIGR02996 family)
MHPDLASLLRYARRYPGDATAHRAIADWLEENGDDDALARARFIRVQLEMADEPFQSPRWMELCQERGAQWDDHLQYWYGGFIDVPGITGAFFSYSMLRLFLDTSILRFGLDRLPSLADWNWVDRLVCEGPTWRGPAARHLAVSSVFADLPELAIHGAYLYDGVVQRFARNPATSGLRWLSLRNCALEENADNDLANSEYLAGLRELVLSGCKITPLGRWRLKERFGDRVKF